MNSPRDFGRPLQGQFSDSIWRFDQLWIELVHLRGIDGDAALLERGLKPAQIAIRTGETLSVT